MARVPDRASPLPKVLDFGISKVDPRGGEQLSLTKTGATVGTPMYMAYEQLAGVPDVDERTDVYAFGVILYEALTGKAPFEASTFSELILKVATQMPLPPKVVRGDIPSPLAAIVVRAMAKDRKERTPSMRVLIAELESFAVEASFQGHMTLPGGKVPSLADSAPGTIDLSAPTDEQRAIYPDAARSLPGEPRAVERSAPALPESSAPRRRPQLRAVAAAVICAVLVLIAWTGWKITSTGSTLPAQSVPKLPSVARVPGAARPPDLPVAPVEATNPSAAAAAGDVQPAAETARREASGAENPRPMGTAAARRKAVFRSPEPQSAPGPAVSAPQVLPAVSASGEAQAAPAPDTAPTSGASHRVNKAPRTSDF